MKLHTKGRQRNQKDRLRVIIQSAQLNGGGDVAQFLERQTGTPLTQVRLPGAARDFSPGQLSVRTLLRVSVHPRAQSHALTSVRTLKIPLSRSEFGGLWKH